jgi:CheY-like chemotaxis protein
MNTSAAIRAVECMPADHRTMCACNPSGLRGTGSHGREDGHVIAQKRQVRDLTDIPVIVVSATARGPIDGADRVLAKPVDAKELVHAVNQLAG